MRIDAINRNQLGSGSAQETFLGGR